METVSRKKPMHTDSDISSIKETIGHHDARIDDLGRRIGGVETQMRSLAGEVSKGFSEIASKLTGIEGSRGPSFGKIVAVAVGCASLMASVCVFVTFMVVSYVTPETTRLALKGDQQDNLLAKLEGDREREFEKLRDEKNGRNEARLNALESLVMPQRWKSVTSR